MYRLPSILLKSPSGAVYSQTFRSEISAKNLRKNFEIHPAFSSSVQINHIHVSSTCLQDKRPGKFIKVDGVNNLIILCGVRSG